MPGWIVAVLRALGIRRAADAVPVATELGATVRDVVDPPQPPPTKPRTGNPSRVAAASAPAAGAVCEAPEGAGAAGTQGAPGPLRPLRKAIDRDLITPREGTRIVAPPRPKAPRKEPDE
jgi:hypothetical protein